jgi:hypothetical protein
MNETLLLFPGSKLLWRNRKFERSSRPRGLRVHESILAGTGSVGRPRQLGFV